MQQRLLWFVFVSYFSFFDNCETAQQLQIENGIPYILSQLFEDRSKPPIILYLEPKQPSHTEKNTEYLRQIPNEKGVDEDVNDNLLRTTQTNERAYILYHLLRTTLDEEEFDQEAGERLQHTKEFLRKAFIGRCQQLSSCVRKCPKPVEKFTCTLQCKQVFDDLNECDQPKEPKCPVSKCGHTMPPSWLL